MPLTRILRGAAVVVAFCLPAGWALAQPANTPADAVPVQVHINETKVLNETDEFFHGTNFVGLWNSVGDSPETIKAFAQSGLKLLRFPGGAPAEWHDWQFNYPARYKDVFTQQQAWNVAKSAGARMVFQTNIANDKADPKDAPFKFDSSGEHQAGWLTYARQQGIIVQWWEIGNEPEMDGPASAKKGGSDSIMRWYNGKYAEQVKAIRKVDPKARIMGGALTNMYQWWAERNLEKFLSAHGDKGGTGLADAISLHWYLGGEKGDWEKSRSVPQSWTKGMQYIRAAIQAYDTRDLPVYITEWNFGGGMNNPSAKQFYTALGNADVAGMFLRTGVKGQTHFCLHGADGNWGMLYMKGRGKEGSEPAPTYYALAMASHLWGKVLETSCGVDEGNVLSAYATQDAKNTLAVMLINKSDKPAAVTLGFEKFRPAGREALVYRLEPSNGNVKDTEVVYNGAPNPPAHKEALPAPQRMHCADKPVIELKPSSMVVVTFADAPPVTAKAERVVVSDAEMARLKVGKIKGMMPAASQP